MDKELFDDLIKSCNEVIEYQKGNLMLRTTVVTVPDKEDEETETINKFNSLSKKNKRIAMVLIDELYKQRKPKKHLTS